MTQKHTEIYYSPYSAEQLFALVMDIEQYPQFLPWCNAARVLSKDEHEVIAELAISFKGFSASYVSRVSPHIASKIVVEMVEGPFKYLHNIWEFIYDESKQMTRIEFTIDFAFSSPLLDKMIGVMFDSALSKMITAFEDRARQIYEVK